MREIETHQNANQSYVDERIKLLEPAQRAHQLFENQPPSEKRKLLDFVLSNCRWKDGPLEAEHREPFDMLAVAVAADQRIGSGSTSKMGQIENWLPIVDTFRTLVIPLSAFELPIGVGPGAATC
jgi:hypothetical protein